MPQILSKKNGRIYKPNSNEESQICPTLKCGSADKNKTTDGKAEDSIVPKVSNQQTLAFGDGEAPKDTRIGPPSPVDLSAPGKTGRTDESTYMQSALVAAKLQLNEWGLPGSSSRKTESGSSSSAASGPVHPSFIKFGSLTPTSSGYNWRKRRFAIDLGRRARVLGKYLCSIDEEDELEFDMYESFKTFHVLP